MSIEYTVIPAPGRAEKSKSAKAGIERFAATLADMLNEMARDGWVYVRAETLPAEERTGLTGRTTVYHNLLVFQRTLARAEPIRPSTEIADIAPTPTPAQPAPAAPATPAAAPIPAADASAPVRAPFTQPMRVAAPSLPASPPTPSQPASRATEPPISAVAAAAPTGPRLGPANR